MTDLTFEEVADVPTQGFAKANPLTSAVEKLDAEFDADLGRSVGALSTVLPDVKAARSTFASQTARAANALPTPRTVRTKWGEPDKGKVTVTFWLVEKITRKRADDNDASADDVAAE